jgi:hypothetical protein
MASLHSRFIRGNLAFYDTHRRRLIDAVGPDVIKYELRPGQIQANAGTGTDPAGWTTTMVEAGLGGSSEVHASNTAGYLWELLTDNAENDGISMQLNGEAFELTSDQNLYFGLEFEINDVTQTDFFVGLAITDTAILGGVTDRIGFESLDGSTDMKFMLEKDSTETLSASLHTLVDATLVFVEFYWNGSTVEAFVNGASAATPAVTNLPNDEALRLSLEFLTGEAVANTMKIRQGRIIQIGR